MEHFPKKILDALKEAIVNVFWKKDDVRSLFRRCDVPSSLIAGQDWHAYKYHIVSPVLDELNTTPEGLGPMRRLLQETLAYTSGDHLLWTSDGEKRKKEAERSLDYLRLLVQDHDAARKTEEDERQARLRAIEESKRGAAFEQKLARIKSRFLAYYQDPDVQKRGYGLEQILYDLFLLFELSPRGPFRRVGEQIDGAFVHDGDHFLLEAKWQTEQVNLADLRDLDGAVGSSLDNTLGLFISLNGFSQQALQAYPQGNRPRLICMEGSDLIAVLDGRIDLADLIRRKKDIAVEKRIILALATDILRGSL